MGKKDGRTVSAFVSKEAFEKIWAEVEHRRYTFQNGGTISAVVAELIDQALKIEKQGETQCP